MSAQTGDGTSCTTVYSFYTVIIVVCFVAGGEKSKNETFLQILQQFKNDGEIVIERKLIISVSQWSGKVLKPETWKRVKWIYKTVDVNVK